MTKYLLDANIFIQAKNQQYGMDFCPAFWEWLVKRNAEDQVYSIQAVGKELTRGKDELSEWAAERGDAFFLPHDQSTIDSMPIVGFRGLRHPLPFPRTISQRLIRCPSSVAG